MTVYYLPLEPYRERYTEQLAGWTERAFRGRGVAFRTVTGAHGVACVRGTPGCTVAHGPGVPAGPCAGSGPGRAAGIATGQVLDAHGRAAYALRQMAALVALLPRVTADDWVWFDDLFTPGYEALAYVCDQTGVWPRVVVRNWAQSVDPDDFTFAMRRWMRRYEELVDRTATLVLVASTCHAEMWAAAGLDADKVRVVGLPFDVAAVRATREQWARPWEERGPLVVYSSRLDREKQPHFLLDVAERLEPPVRLVVCTGSDEPRSNDASAVARLLALEDAGRVEVWRGLTKARYYHLLGEARAHLNTARQDFVSFTALEASAFDVPTLAPAFRSFPEALENRRTQLYVPWSVDDCVERLVALLADGEHRCARLADYHGGTFGRTFDAMGL
jgi:glycosyltransferase involved in cell wall biosynthesis